MSQLYVLSYLHAAPLLAARQAGQASAETSLDLGLTASQLSLAPGGVLLPDGQRLDWETVAGIAADESVCYAVQDSAAFKIQQFSDVQNLIYVLMPTQRAPTILLSGIQMHRVKEIDPWGDTLEKVRTLSPWPAEPCRVLDTCTGLGYTAIAAAETARQVTTIEIDPNVLEVARLNPWSRSLFDHPRIHQVMGDSFEQVQEFEDAAFERIIHDPPMLSLAGDLYSGEFYRHLHRLLARRGRLYHYVGDPDSRSGRNITRSVTRRLQEAGFRKVVARRRAFGLLAYK
ncbi:MAG: methyltransferase [Anaerolineae bacterium]